MFEGVWADLDLGIRVRTELSGLLRDVGLESDALQAGVLDLERRFGEIVYSSIFHRLAHLSLDPPEAKRHWEQIFVHRDEMSHRLGSSVDLRVALLDYFVQVQRKLDNPMIIETRHFELAQDSIYRDELTGLFNYRYLAQHLPGEIVRSRNRAPLSVVMIDADNFKVLNDRHGHEAGNAALALIANVIRQALGDWGTPVRYGGEEFVLVLPGTAKREAFGLAEELRRTIEREPFESGADTCALTISLGVATCPADATEAADLVRSADEAMYVAKAEGRNCVRAYGDSTRSFRRRTTSIPCRYRTFQHEYQPATIVSASEGGLLLVMERALARGTLIEIDGSMTDGPAAGTLARVVRSSGRRDGAFEVAVALVANASAEIDWAKRVALAAEESSRPTRAGS